MPTDLDSTYHILRDVVRALDDKKAADIRVLQVSAQSSITDYLLLATGTSEPHLRALRVELEKILDARHVKIAGMDTGETGSGWTVVDAFQLMVHLFTQEKREEYRLENLWKDAREILVADLLASEEKVKAGAKKASVRKASGKAKTVAVKKSPAAKKSPKKPTASKSKATPAKKPRVKKSKD
ncbi:MAG TPA: ribosome silencing factor [Opitutaceae bacterium]|nr:ribosome silencing factor [Opitutaceae bacterium]